MGRRFSHIFKSQVTSETESNQRDARITRGRVIDDRSQILCRPTMVKANEPVWFCPAATEIPGQHIPTGGRQSCGHPPDVALVGRALQPVRQNRESIATLAKPAEIKEITILQF